MFGHILLLIYRNFRRFKTTFLINLIGLSTGLTSVLLIYLWVADEMNMDKFHKTDDRLYRVMVNAFRSDKIETSPSTQPILAEALRAEIPEIENAVAAVGGPIDFTLSKDDRHILANGLLAEKDLFSIMSFDLVDGDVNALRDKKSIAISEDVAKALFNTTDNIIGKTMEWQFPYGKDQVSVGMVFKNIGSNSSMRFGFVLSMDVYKDMVGKESLHWGNFGADTYVVLHKGADLTSVNKKLEKFLDTKSKDSNMTMFLLPYSAYYLYGNYNNGKQAGGRIEYVRLFSIIGIFILLIACINFMNLSTAKASRRIKEVGIKKAIGARRSTLITQYFAESMLMALVSSLMALLLVDVLLPQFNLITGKQLSLTLNTPVMATLLIVMFLTGLIAGSYPALYLSSFNPSSILRNKVTATSGGITDIIARKGLIIFQFALSVVFISAVLVIYKQIQYVQTTYLGYDKEHIIYIKPEGKVSANLETFLTEVKKVKGVLNASTIARNIVGAQNSTVGYFMWEGKDPDSVIPFEIVNGNYDLIETLGIQMKEGRSFSRSFPVDTASIIFNEAGIAVMGFKQPIGQNFNLWGKNYTIIGVAKDFHFESLHEKVKPLFMRLVPEEAERVMIKVEGSNQQQTIADLGRFYQTFNPGFTFDYKFVDEDYQKQYDAERRVSTLSKYFAGLAILISCLGLFGLASFTAEKRLKEIGIRKVLGSSVTGIVYLLSVDFTKIVLVAITIALPISYFLTNQWLQGFAFKITLHWWYFVGAGVLSLCIAWLTVCSQAVKAARTNPTQCLKDE